MSSSWLVGFNERVSKLFHFFPVGRARDDRYSRRLGRSKNRANFFTSYKANGIARVANKNDRVQLEMKIMKYRQLARQAGSDDVTRRRMEELISELARKLREIDE
jgi:hypothetical protein